MLITLHYPDTVSLGMQAFVTCPRSQSSSLRLLAAFPFRSSTHPSSTTMLSISLRECFNLRSIVHIASCSACSTAAAVVSRLTETVRHGIMAAIYESMYARYWKYDWECMAARRLLSLERHVAIVHFLSVSIVFTLVVDSKHQRGCRHPEWRHYFCRF